MAAKKYLSVASGVITEVQATVTSAGAGDDGKIVALDATGKLDSTVMPAGTGADTVSVTCSEDLAAGDWVNLWNDSGTGKVRKADATTAGKEANGFVLAGATSGNAATVYLSSTNTQVSALTPGTIYYLATTPGAETSTAPSSSGNIVQILGRTVSATALPFRPSPPITLA